MYNMAIPMPASQSSDTMSFDPLKKVKGEHPFLVVYYLEDTAARGDSQDRCACCQNSKPFEGKIQ